MSVRTRNSYWSFEVQPMKQTPVFQVCCMSVKYFRVIVNTIFSIQFKVMKLTSSRTQVKAQSSAFLVALLIAKDEFIKINAQ